ncbi:uncharacterized protein Bfra_009441 [Botrytis fragariae]|uniref:Uncharacterized protein n=1 Tax=Botrytis fragariae TaxID=1964551 RepID=A0A8H6EG44_9HELO|nr:uncharacterized protein Bfra_009441 [Botrytis fragariae]KAF5870886.1 hypothetical protein Bfra_009441 [Botrytis fragariae]
MFWMESTDTLGWKYVFGYREDLARVRFLPLYDIFGERDWESRIIDSQSGREELTRDLPSTVIQLASLCVHLEKFCWVVGEEEGRGGGESSDFLQMYRSESDTHTHTQDSSGNLEPEKIHTISNPNETREKLQIERERWQRMTCLRSTKELEVGRDMYNFLPAIPLIVDDYKEKTLHRQVMTFRNMVCYRYVPWKWYLINSNVQPKCRCGDHHKTRGVKMGVFRQPLIPLYSNHPLIIPEIFK